ncbi:MAG: FAD-dependent oxidoreductase [Geminicoccaceae bacterium]
MAERMVIVGAGQAGGRAALTLRAEGHAGPVTLLGAEPLAPYERPPLSKGYLTGKADAASFTFAGADALAAAGIDFRPGCAVAAIDRGAREVVLAGGGRIAYDRLLLATGRDARRLPLAGPAADRVRYLRSLADADLLAADLRRGGHLVVIGGGFIGLEVAASAVELGCPVTVVELAPRLLGRAVPAELAAVLHERHLAAGIAIRLATGIAAVEEAGDGLAVVLTDGTRLDAATVLAGVGSVPCTGLAEAAGLAVDHGIVVDATLATSDPAILAAGDCCAFPGPDGTLLRLESWQNADRQGARAGRNMLGAAEVSREPPWFWSDQHELTLQIAGHPAAGRRTVDRPVEGGRLLFHLDDANAIVGVSSVGPASVAREAKLAQLLLERGLAPDPALLADPATRLKALLR